MTATATQKGTEAAVAPATRPESSGGKSRLFLLLSLTAAWYAFWLFLPKTRPVPLDLTFNSMLQHLLHGQFYVDANLVGDEGYLRGGHVYAYWGIWCALLRLPLWIIGRLDVDITALSCLTALLIAVTAKLRLLFRLKSLAPQNAVAKSGCNLMLAYILLGGSDATHLRSYIFEEVTLWAYAFAAVFVYFAVKGIVERRFSVGALSAMAVCTGLAVATRVSGGLGLTVAFGLLILVLVAQSARTASGGGLSFQSYWKAATSRRILIPLGILAVCLLATAFVNYMRWGNPLTFVDYRLYVGNRLWPDRPIREALYGNFNLVRVPLSFLYYFFPVWSVHTASGNLLFGAAQVRLYDLVELPPSSFLVTDLLAICFIGFLVAAIVRRRSSLAWLAQSGALAAGLCVPCGLMLCFVALTYRYRLEFYPFIDFLSFLGLYLVVSDDGVHAWFAKARRWMTAAAVVTVAGTAVTLLMYMHSTFGPAQITLQPALAQKTTLVAK